MPHAYAKERRLVDEVKFELSQGRRCQIFAVFTVKHDVTQRLKALPGVSTFQAAAAATS